MLLLILCPEPVLANKLLRFIGKEVRLKRSLPSAHQGFVPLELAVEAGHEETACYLRNSSFIRKAS